MIDALRAFPGRGTASEYAQAVAATVAALVLWLAIGRPLGATPYLFLLPAVVGASWQNGLRPGVVVTLVGSLAGAFLYVPPTTNVGIRSVQEVILIVLFIVVALAISWLNESRIRNERTMRESEARTRQTLKTLSDADKRLAFLAEAGAVLASSLDYETTLASVARLAVPEIGDWCAIHIVEETGQVRQLGATHVDPAKVKLAQELEHRLPYDPSAPNGVPEVLRTGKAELIPTITDEMLVVAVPDRELLEILRDLGLRSSMVVPLVARGHTLGAITLIAAESGRQYGQSDVALAEDLAARAALAVDNARLYREAQRIGAERSAILAQMADGVAIVDVEGNIVFTNDAARRLIGGTGATTSLASAVDTYRVATLGGDPYPVEELPLGRALRVRETVIDAEWRVQRHDGIHIIMQGSAAPLVGEDGTLLGAVSTFRDVTAQRSLERQKDDFLSAAAHDLKTPLTTIKGLAQILQRRARRISADETTPLLEGLGQIDVATTRMTRLINELLDASRIEMNRPLPLNAQTTDLVVLTKNVVDEFQRSTDGHKVILTTDESELAGRWDGERLERVLINLLSNAVKYSPDGGEVVVSLSKDGYMGQSDAVIGVADHGIGIPTSDLPKIFERFYRAQNVDGRIPGTGIGLAGAKQIVEQHGGTIAIESQENLGTKVIIRLPISLSKEVVTRSGADHA